MKKLFFICLLFFSGIEGYSQSCGDNGFRKIGSQFGTERLSSNCVDFNCHGFAAAYWEEGFTQGTSLNSTNPGNVNVQTSTPIPVEVLRKLTFGILHFMFRFAVKVSRMWM